MLPLRTARVAPSTAWIPPKRLTTSSASSSVVPSSATSFTDDHLLALAEQALGPEGHQADQQQARDRQSNRRDTGLRERRVREIDEPRALEDEPEEHRANGDPPVAPHASEDEHAE